MSSAPPTAQDAARAGMWSGVDLLLRQGLQFAVTVTLARFLAPQEFGIVALLAVFTGLWTVLLEGGANTALIRTRSSTHVQESSVFWFNLAAGLLCAALLLLIAPLVARFYAIPLLVPLMSVTAVQVVLVSLGSIQTALLVRALRFRSLVLVGLGSTIVSGSLAVALAISGFGVWALSLQALAGAAATTIGLWLASRWRPAARFSFSEARALFRFGSHIVISGVLDVLYTQGFALLIGKMHGVRDVGLYARAQNTQALPTGIVAGIIGRVTLPVLATRVDDPEGLRRAVSRATRLAMALSMPLAIGLASLADAAVFLLYGPAWAPAGPILCVLAIAASFYPHAIILQHGILAQDKSQAYLNLIMAKQALALATMVVGSFFGIMGLAYSQIFNGIGGTLLNAAAARRHIGYGFGDQARDLGGVVAIAAAMGLAIAWLRAVTEFPPHLDAAVFIPAGAAIYVLLALVFRVGPVLEALQLSGTMLRGLAARLRAAPSRKA